MAERYVNDMWLTPDSDGDGLSDDFETDVLGTDPRKRDTDGDGLSDLREKDFGSNARLRDSDWDGLDDGREVTVGTNPADPDTDHDGVDDRTEVLRDSPTAPDSDHDGTPDWVEDARDRDFDRDGLKDGEEAWLRTDPFYPDRQNVFYRQVPPQLGFSAATPIRPEPPPDRTNGAAGESTAVAAPLQGPGLAANDTDTDPVDPRAVASGDAHPDDAYPLGPAAPGGGDADAAVAPGRARYIDDADDPVDVGHADDPVDVGYPDDGDTGPAHAESPPPGEDVPALGETSVPDDIPDAGDQYAAVHGEDDIGEDAYASDGPSGFQDSYTDDTYA